MDIASIKSILKLANHKEYPWIKRRREVVKDKRYIFSVRSDFLAKYTDIWYRNRYPDTERVHEIMKSIKKENEIDNRIYLALIKDRPHEDKLLCFDGNHRREALIRMYRMDGFTCWVDLDILIDVSDAEVISAFRRINQAVNLPDAYLEDDPSPVQPCEEFVKQFMEKWPGIIVDRKSTRAPYCTKNQLIDLVHPFIRESNLMEKFIKINKEHMGVKYAASTMKICDEHNVCYIFAEGCGAVRKSLLTK